MLRYAIAISAGLSIFFLGLRESRLLFLKADISDKIKNAASRICTAIRFCHAVKSELLSELPFENSSTLQLADKADVLNFLETVPFPFGERESEETAGFISSLGKGALEEQLLLSEGFKEFWTQVYREAKEAYDKKSRLCITLGSLAGIATAIILM